MMKKIEVEPVDFTGQIKGQLREFIRNSNSLNHKDRDALIIELDYNHHDGRFNGENFMDAAISRAESRWRDTNFERMELWKKVVIENSGRSDNPQLTANDVLDEFDKQFNPE